MTFTKGGDPFQRLQLQIIDAVAEFERGMIRERQRGGIAIAKREGKYTGRKPSFTADKIKLAREILRDGATKTSVAKYFGINRMGLYKALGGKTK